MSAPVTGRCDPAFTGVHDVLGELLASGADTGSALTVRVGGRTVVDLWGGLADARERRPWTEHTRCVIFSATKAVTAVAALRQVERGRVDLSAPVASWWPAFAAHGKDTTTGEHLLTHRAGLPAFDRPITVAEAADPDAMADQLAGQAPEWEPGTAVGYHALTFGWLVGELVRRTTGRRLADVVRDELGADLHLGVDPARATDLARLAAGRRVRLGATPIAPDAGEPDAKQVAVRAALADPKSPMMRSTGNPAASFNNPAVLAAGWPAAGLVCTARALARFYDRLRRGELLAPDTLREAVRERWRGPDRTLVLETAFGLGFMRPNECMVVPEAGRRNAFGHPGASGSLGLADPAADLAFAYIPNVIRGLGEDGRAARLLEAVYAAL